MSFGLKLSGVGGRECPGNTQSHIAVLSTPCRASCAEPGLSNGMLHLRSTNIPYRTPSNAQRYFPEGVGNWEGNVIIWPVCRLFTANLHNSKKPNPLWVRYTMKHKQDNNPAEEEGERRKGKGNTITEGSDRCPIMVQGQPRVNRSRH